MKNLFLVLVLMAISLSWQYVSADDCNFSDHQWWSWNLTDYPRWHFAGDYVEGPSGIWAPQVVEYIQIELKFSENTLIEPNVIHMYFEVRIDYNYWGFYFDINPGEMETVQQFPINYQDEDEIAEWYIMRELNTIPDGGGYIVIDEEESMLDIFGYNLAVEPESLGEVKALFN
jgi:hypothetical protein